MLIHIIRAAQEEWWNPSRSMKRTCRHPAKGPAALMLVLILSTLAPSPVAARLLGKSSDWQTGKAIFERKCALCHGVRGKGDGPVGVALLSTGIRVADLTNEQLMSRLSRETIFNVIKNGGDSVGLSNLMPSWSKQFSEGDIDAVTLYVTSLPRWAGKPTATIDNRDREGKEVFVMHCISCHGPRGKGDGQAASYLKIKYQVSPKDLTDTSYFGARTDDEIYRAIELGGLHLGVSSYMPAWGHLLSAPEIRSLVKYIRALSGTAPVN